MNNEVILTTDDHPYPYGRVTEYTLAALQKCQVKAVFFLIGERVDQLPHLARAIVNGGHVVGCHTQYHYSNNSVSTLQDISQGCVTLTDRLDVKPRLFRPPGGNRTRELPKQLATLGMTMMLWHVSVPNTPDVEAVVQEVLDCKETPCIINMHTPWQVIEPLYRRLTDMGYKFVLPKGP
jgi:peptidoglycan/xylan/chitin deacetylase (PgdA/CDA1 family)